LSRRLFDTVLLGVTVRIRTTTMVVVALVLVASFGVYLGNRVMDVDLQLPRPGRACTVHDGDADQPVEPPRSVKLNSAQMANAATIAATGIRRELPERAVVIALATAFQESGLENLAGGDRDSVGLFQQRPSQGWGKPERIRDPRYAANRFYTALKKVRGWEKMRVTDAAQAVQRSAYPEAYEKWADEAEVLARALVGNTSAAVTCSVTREPAVRGSAAAAALTAGLRLDWGRLTTAEPDGMPGVMVSAGSARAGWRYAHWLVSHAADHGVKRVRFGDLQWTADAGEWAPGPERSTTGQVIAEVFANV